MKKKTIWSLVLALALVVTAIGTATSAFAATSAPMEPVTKIATENEDAIWEQIEAVEEKSDAIFQRNAALWEKLDEICNALPDDYDFTDFDEAAFIRSTNALTEAEKELRQITCTSASAHTTGRSRRHSPSPAFRCHARAGRST